MKLKEFAPGIYKVRKVDNVSVFAPKHPRLSPNPVRLLRVGPLGDSNRFFFDHDQMGAHPNEVDDEYEIIEKYKGLPVVGNGLIILKFKDGSGEEFEFKVRSIDHMKSLFDQMPWLRKPFGYVRRKN